MDLVHPDDTELVMSQWNTLVQGRPVSFEMRWKNPSNAPGSPQWVLASSCPILGENGETISISGTTIDINGQKKTAEASAARLEALEQARVSEMKFARFAELSPSAIYIARPDKNAGGLCTLQYVNDQFFQLTGHQRVPFGQIKWEQVVVREDMEKVRHMFSNITGGSTAEPVQLKLKKTWTDQEGNRSEMWVQGSSYPELDENGSVISKNFTLAAFLVFIN